ncbi:zinc finger SWIM domain protein [Rippkaea orientalis PCC 8801]|uniref:Zinc finger SWIM domain protein n=1 Tax=Rippkaea orientalis (strain PCC 8801 / RF-1) TaxID=41431 RepID=B7JUX6_RIPO1|nr:SWIM zinc finger family protein [Rippkaea orientalis]ACK66828.1 zinc finger SWIM domain protein [Rippkaea orientalis PCC 8801]
MTIANVPNNDPNLLEQEWWVKRWLELLDSYRFKKRLERARLYAREGNILSIEFKDAQVLAKVQGSEAEPYQVSLSLVPFSDEDWSYIIESLSEKAIFSAQLLAGEMPENIEQVFIQNGLNVFPFTLSDIHSRCTCPDKANPCKHIGAIYYQLADRFSEDPFIIFQLRGRSKDQILQALRELRLKQLAEQDNTNSSTIEENVEQQTENLKPIEDEYQSLNLQKFWQYDHPLDSSLVVIVPPPDNQTVLDVLGRLPLSHEEAQLVKQYLQQVYQTVSQQAVIKALNSET